MAKPDSTAAELRVEIDIIEQAHRTKMNRLRAYLRTVEAEEAEKGAAQEDLVE